MSDVEKSAARNVFKHLIMNMLHLIFTMAPTFAHTGETKIMMASSRRSISVNGIKN
jgi:hypothetical protein